MGRFNGVHTKFWTDQAVEELSPQAKLVFLYLLTSPHRTPSGLYPISRARMASDTGLTLEDVIGALDELSNRDLVLYDLEAGCVLIVQSVKYLHQRGERMRVSVVNDILLNNTPLVGPLLDRHPFIVKWIAEVARKKELTDDQREHINNLTRNQQVM